MAAFGTDHDLMQRLLTVETRRESQRTLSLTPLGTLRDARHLPQPSARGSTRTTRSIPAQPLPRPDEIFPHFVRTAMPELAARPHAERHRARVHRLAARLALRLVRRPTSTGRCSCAAGASATTCCVSRVAVVVFGLRPRRCSPGDSRSSTRSSGSRSRSRASRSARCSASSCSGSLTRAARQPRQRGGDGRDGRS